jgi:hypothetical protein
MKETNNAQAWRRTLSSNTEIRLNHQEFNILNTSFNKKNFESQVDLEHFLKKMFAFFYVFPHFYEI